MSIIGVKGLGFKVDQFYTYGEFYRMSLLKRGVFSPLLLSNASKPRHGAFYWFKTQPETPLIFLSSPLRLPLSCYLLVFLPHLQKPLFLLLLSVSHPPAACFFFFNFLFFFLLLAFFFSPIFHTRGTYDHFSLLLLPLTTPSF